MDDFDRASLRKRLAYWPVGGALKVHGRIVAYKRPSAEQLAALREGDELWWYESPEVTWEMLCGREGFATVRGGEIVDLAYTAIN